MLPNRSALVLIHFQQTWKDPYWGERNNPSAEDHAARILHAFRASRRPVIHIRQVSRDPNSPFFAEGAGCAFMDALRPEPGDLTLTQETSAQAVMDELESHLRTLSLDRVVLAGFTTGGNVSGLARLAAGRGMKVLVVHDACASVALEDTEGVVIPPEVLHRAALAELQGTCAVVLGHKALSNHL